MSEQDLEKLLEHFRQIRIECDTPEKATALLQRDGILDENGQPAAQFREESVLACQ